MTPMFNATQSIGLAATALTLFACIAATRPPWRMLAALHGLMFLEVLFGLRHRIHAMGSRELMAGNIYAERNGLQIALLAALLIGALAILWIAGRQKRAAARIGILSSGALAAIFVVEAISLHAIDALLYRQTGPLMVIAFAWVGLCTITAIAALADRRVRDRRKRRRS